MRLNFNASLYHYVLYNNNFITQKLKICFYDSHFGHMYNVNSINIVYSIIEYIRHNLHKHAYTAAYKCLFAPECVNPEFLINLSIV